MTYKAFLTLRRGLFEAIQIQQSSFLPQSNLGYTDQLRHQGAEQAIEGSAGDIPILGQVPPPYNGPTVRQRYDAKDLSLFQFSQEFKERFGAIWNEEDRWVPPTSPLRPGDVVYYKVYVNTNGTLDHFENLTRKQKPNKDYSDLDKLFTTVISGVFPMSVPDRIPKNAQIAEVLAIQVVDGSSMVMHFSH